MAGTFIPRLARAVPLGIVGRTYGRGLPDEGGRRWAERGTVADARRLTGQTIANLPVNTTAIMGRAQRSVSGLNSGDFDPLFSGYVDDVEVRIPFYRKTDPLGPPVTYGKSPWRQYLTEYMQRNGSFTLVSANQAKGGMLIVVEDSQRQSIALSIEMDSDHLGRVVTVFIV